MSKKVAIRRLPTGVPGLDAILGGGLPEYSFNLIAGIPGSGKTTLAHQMMFHLANPARRALYFTVLGEPPLKMLRYQQQFPFFDPDKVGTSIRFVNLASDLLKRDLKKVLDTIVQEVEADSPGLVFIDSFRSVMLAVENQPGADNALQGFVQELGMHLTSWEATTFLVGEYDDADSQSNPIFTVADGLIWLTQETYQGSMVRKLEVKKMRGQATLPGQHTFRIGDHGVQVFPRRIQESSMQKAKPGRSRAIKRMSLGVPALDEMLGGGLPEGYSLLVAGPSGSGKTILATEFLSEGVRRGENGVVAAFEKSPGLSLSRALDPMVRSKKVGIISTRSLDLSIDETLHEISENVKRLKAKRVVIDSLSGFELALAPSYRDDFRDSTYRMISALTSMGVTVLVTSELEDRYTDLRFSPYGAAFLTDAIIVERYVQLEDELRRCLAVVKVRDSDHSKELREFKVVKGRIVIGDALSGYEGLLSGRVTAREPALRRAGAKKR
ncbi:MAG: AAA family ATPase [Burkholderiales bacterium]|nr:AAA family ATPase [Burkholderiales bacterium]